MRITVWKEWSGWKFERLWRNSKVYLKNQEQYFRGALCFRYEFNRDWESIIKWFQLETMVTVMDCKFFIMVSANYLLSWMICLKKCECHFELGFCGFMEWTLSGFFVLNWKEGWILRRTHDFLRKFKCFLIHSMVSCFHESELQAKVWNWKSRMLTVEWARNW